MENYWGVALVVFVCLLFGLGAGLAFLWAGRSGQFEDIEGVKYRMLEHESEEESSQAIERSGHHIEGIISGQETDL